MASLAQKLSEIVGGVFNAQGLAAELGIVRVSDRPDLAQFQCNGALPAAKQTGKNPREIAAKIVESLQACHPDRTPAKAGGVEGSKKDPSASDLRSCAQDDGSIFSKIEIAGPGFINLNVTDEFLAAHLAGSGERFGIEKAVAETIVLDYGGPNVAKPMHVGHLRSAIIGDTLRRICVFAGYKAIGDVHLGDWGTQMGQIISELEIRHPGWPYFDPAFTGQYPKESPVTLDDLEEIYPAASLACKEDEERMERARAATVDLQNSRPGYRALWQHFVDVSVTSVKANFESLDVHFDLWNGESSVHDLIAPMVDDLRKATIARESDGALVVDVAKGDDKKEIPPLILYKRDGAVMYGTTDLATVLERVRDFQPAKIVYVTDQRQNLHFEQVFRAARKEAAGFPPIAPENVELVHAGFGTMNGIDGKPFKTRAGGVMKLEELIRMGVEKAEARLKEAELAQDGSETERAGIAHKVAIAAIKFADLHNNRVADYVFDIDRLTSFEGKTGPYLLYQAVRIKSLLKKAGYKYGGAKLVIQDEDRKLALLLTEFPDYFAVALRDYAPHVLCDYAFRLAQEFSGFYASCHILSEPDAALKASRLALCDLTQRQLALILDLLGIQIPERM